MHIGNTALEIDFFTGLDDWMSPEISRCQRFAGALAAADHDEARARLEDLARSLAAPPTRAHNLVLAPLLLETAVRFSEHMHRGIPRSGCPCRSISAKTIRLFLDWREQNAVRVFGAWTREFFEEYERHHPVLPADRLAGLIRKQPDRPWTVASLAKAAGVPTRGLARAFRRQYGETVRNYVHLCRMNTMLSGWSPRMKIEAVALEVGYRSRKDFYRVLRQTMHMTPQVLRSLPPNERTKWQRHLRARLEPLTRVTNESTRVVYGSVRVDHGSERVRTGRLRVGTGH